MTEQARLFGLCLAGSVLAHAAVLGMRVERPRRLARPETTAVVWRLTADSEPSSAVSQAPEPAAGRSAGAPDRTIVRAEQPPALEDTTKPEKSRVEQKPEPKHDQPANREKAAKHDERTLVQSGVPARRAAAPAANEAAARTQAVAAPPATPPPSIAAAAPSAAAEAFASSVASLPGASAHPAAESARGDQTKIRASYEQVLAAWIERHKFYPPLALRRREEGTVRLRIAIDRDGRVVESALREPSRIASLDRAALDIVRRADPFPAPPAELAGEGFEFVVPIRFSLAER